MAIQLTEEQRQAIENQSGRPVEVVDPTSHQTYLLISRELYTRMQALLEQAGEEAGSCPSHHPETQPMRQRVKDLPTPHAVATFAQKWCGQLGLIGQKARQDLTERLKLQHYYGGQWIAYLRTDDGPVVVAAGKHVNDPAFEKKLSFLTEEERRSAIIDSPTKLFD